MGVIVELKTELYSDGDDSDTYSTEYVGEIYSTNENDEGESIGKIKCYKIDILSAVLSESDVLLLLDNVGLEDFYISMFDFNESSLKNDIQVDFLQPSFPLMIVIDKIYIREKFVGYGYGLKALQLFLSHIGSGCDLAALKACPLQFTEGPLTNEFSNYLCLEEGLAKIKLQNHYKKIDFISYGKDGFMIKPLRINDRRITN